ncbi:hypothetical protein HAZT_HAZT005140 [Hyalella azteca]|uniref:EXS domain-containing protein n=1 Tax=Hyalella azteca TaxID=294128 RepID=A0A6A0GZY1_HYAAZ|nr:hypothetical protein HAZT_HAZT005140 [Hyalella azteca]
MIVMMIVVCGVAGVIWALSLLGFLYADDLSIPPYSVPISLVFFMMAFLFNPSHTFHHEARFWLIRKLGRVIVAPFAFVQFADFWLGDQLNTLVFALKDFEYTFCFYTFDNIDWRHAACGDSEQCSDPTRIIASVVSCLPAWFRFAQCLRRYKDTREKFPHLANAFKYATTFFVVRYCRRYGGNQYSSKTANPFFYMLVVSRIFSSCFVLWWDLRMDWGVFESNCGDYKFLREEIVYSSPNNTHPKQANDPG